jgi:hypothetical protein
MNPDPQQNPPQDPNQQSTPPVVNPQPADQASIQADTSVTPELNNSPTPGAYTPPEQNTTQAAPVEASTQTAQQAPVVPQPQHSDTIGILSIIFAIFAPLVGLILALIGRSKAKKEGYVSKLSKIGLILSIVFLVLNTLFVALYIMLVVVSVSKNETAKNAQTDVALDINNTYTNVELYYNENGVYPLAIEPSFTSSNNTLTADSFNVVVVDTDIEAKAEVSTNADSQPYTYVVFDCSDNGCKGYYIAHNSEDGTPVSTKVGLSNGY